MQKLEIRKAVSGEASRVAVVLYESFIEYKSFYSDEAFAVTTPASEQIQRSINECSVLVALQDEVIVGTAAAMPCRDSYYVQSMGVLPLARGLRIGEILLKRIEDDASGECYKRLFLSTTPFLHRAIKLYERFGFRRTGEPPHELFGTPLFTMEKILETTTRKPGL